MEFRLADTDGKPMSTDEVKAYLDRPNIMRIALVDERDSCPMVHPVWFYYENGLFFVATDRDGVKARSLRKNPNLYFLVDSDPVDGPPHGVRGKALAAVVDDPEYATKVTRRNIIRYIGSLESESARMILEKGKDSSVLEITPPAVHCDMEILRS